MGGEVGETHDAVDVLLGRDVLRGAGKVLIVNIELRCLEKEGICLKESQVKTCNSIENGTLKSKCTSGF